VRVTGSLSPSFFGPSLSSLHATPESSSANNTNGILFMVSGI